MKLRNELLGQKQSLRGAIAREFLQNIIFFGINGDRQIGRQCPRRRRPDRDARICQRVRRTRSTDDRKLNVNGRVITFLVFHFGFSQRSLSAGAPKNRLLRLVNQTFLYEHGKRAKDLRFVFGIHRQVGTLPVAEYAQPFELLALDVDVFAGELFAFLADFQRRKLARFLDDFVFDWQAVTIPAGNVRRALAQHRLRFHDEIF